MIGRILVFRLQFFEQCASFVLLSIFPQRERKDIAAISAHLAPVEVLTVAEFFDRTRQVFESLGSDTRLAEIKRRAARSIRFVIFLEQ